MTFEQAEKFEFNPFDLTKVWSQADYPLIPVGEILMKVYHERLQDDNDLIVRKDHSEQKSQKLFCRSGTTGILSSSSCAWYRTKVIMMMFIMIMMLMMTIV